MRFAATAILFLLIPSVSLCRKGNHALEDATAVARKAEDQLTNTPNLTPEQTTQLRQEKAGAVEKIETIANSDPKDTGTQLEVSRSLASVSEAPRAVPFAERGLKLAEASGDPKMVREALLTGSEVYYKAGNYELARERAERILKVNPKDKDAMALYMQVKGRSTASGATPAGGAASGGAGAAGQRDGGGAAATPAAARGPGVAMTNPGTLEAQKLIALGWSRIKLDANAALKNFDAAVTADPKSAAVRVQRSKARAEAGDAAGAREDADAAIALDPALGEAYAARAEAKRALGLAEAELLADYEAAAKLDGNFAGAYKAARLRGGAADASADGAPGARDASGASAPDGPHGLLARATKGWGLFALICAVVAAAGAIIAPVMLRRRRSAEDDSLPR